MRKVILLLTLVLCCALSFGQVGYTGSPVINGVGQPIAGASVAISLTNPCGSSPAYANCGGFPQGAYTGALPPASLASLFTDVTLGTAGPNPVTTDGFGNWSIYLATGSVMWVTVYGPGIYPQVFVLTLGTGGGGGGGTITGATPGQGLVVTGTTLGLIACTNGQFLSYNSGISQWVCTTPSGGGGTGTVTSITAGTGIETTVNPITVVGTMRVANPLGSVLTVDGVDHTSQGGANSSTLCTTLHYLSLHPALYWTVVDNFPERGANAWVLDPFNDPACGNKALGYKLKLGDGTWMTNWPSIFIPSSVEVELTSRASENQVNPSNQVSGSLLIACANTSLVGFGGTGPWTGSFTMSCPSTTNFPGGFITALSRDGAKQVTVTTATAHNYTAAMAAASPPVLITIANTDSAGTSFNGTYAITGAPSASTLTYTQTSGGIESGTVNAYSTVGSPLIVMGNSGVGNNDFGSVLHGGTLSTAGIPGSIGLTNITCQERCWADQVTIVGWYTYCIDNERSQAQNYDFGHMECLSGFKTGATLGTPPSAACVKWSVNGPSRGFEKITCNPRGAATVAPILCDVFLDGTQGGEYHAEHMENAQYQYCIRADPVTGVTTRDSFITTVNTGSILQGQTITTFNRLTSIVTVNTAQDNASITGEKVTIANAFGVALTLTSVNTTGAYQGTITGGAANALVGTPFTITGFANGANNIVNAVCTASTATALTFAAVTITETHAGVASDSFNGNFTITRISATQFTYIQTGAVNDSGTGGTETLGGKATIKLCGTASTDAVCGPSNSNTVRNTIIGSVRISPSLVVNAVEDDTANAGVGRTITAAQWAGSYFQTPPDFGSALSSTNGGTGLIAPAAHSFILAQAAGAMTLLTSPAVNGYYACGFNVIASVAVDPTCTLQGVVPDARTTTTEAFTSLNRGGFVTFSNGGAIAVTLPQAGSTGFTNNYVVLACDIGAGTATITPTTSTISFTTGSAYTSGSATMTLTTGQCAFIYSDNTNYFANRR